MVTNNPTVRVRFLRNHEVNWGTWTQFFRKGEVADIPQEYWEKGTVTMVNPNPVGLKDVVPPVAVLVTEKKEREK